MSIFETSFLFSMLIFCLFLGIVMPMDADPNALAPYVRLSCCRVFALCYYFSAVYVHRHVYDQKRIAISYAFCFWAE